MSSFFSRRVFGAAAQSASSSSTSGAAPTGRLDAFAKAYYQRYIKTSSVVPVLHVMAFYSVGHWLHTYKAKHKYQTTNRFH